MDGKVEPAREQRARPEAYAFGPLFTLGVCESSRVALAFSHLCSDVVSIDGRPGRTSLSLIREHVICKHDQVFERGAGGLQSSTRHEMETFRCIGYAPDCVSDARGARELDRCDVELLREQREAQDEKSTQLRGVHSGYYSDSGGRLHGN